MMVVNQCERLMDVLFCHPEREHIDVKFLSFGNDPSIRKDDFCEAAADFLTQMHARIGADEAFSEDFEPVDVRDLIAGR